MKNSEIDFVAKHYREGRFSVAEAWKRLGIEPVRRFRRLRIAAAVAGAVFLSAAAAVLYHRYEAVPESVELMPVAPAQAVRLMDFDDMPLTAVVERIREVYGVEVANVPADAAEQRLSLRYEGNAADLVAAINDILGTEMQVVEP